MAGELPGAVLFACSQNAIRSPIAEGLTRHFFGHKTSVASCGVRAGEPDPFVITVMDELGIDLRRHRRSTLFIIINMTVEETAVP
jgi:protein-tyrosine-phosphatase